MRLQDLIEDVKERLLFKSIAAIVILGLLAVSRGETDIGLLAIYILVAFVGLVVLLVAGNRLLGALD